MKRGTKARRHGGTKWCSREKGSARDSHFAPLPLVPTSWLRAFVPLCLLLSSCTYTTGQDEPQTFNQKQEEAVRDPMNYKPDNENTRPYDISGGGFNNFDKKAFKK